MDKRKEKKKQEQRRLDMLLPADHPLWGIPTGQRSETARRWLDLGFQSENYIEKLEQRLVIFEELLSRLEEKNDALEQYMSEIQAALVSLTAKIEEGGAGVISKPSPDKRKVDAQLLFRSFNGVSGTAEDRLKRTSEQ